MQQHFLLLFAYHESNCVRQLQLSRPDPAGALAADVLVLLSQNYGQVNWCVLKIVCNCNKLLGFWLKVVLYGGSCYTQCVAAQLVRTCFMQHYCTACNVV